MWTVIPKQISHGFSILKSCELLFPPPGIFPDSGVESVSPAFTGDSLPPTTWSEDYSQVIKMGIKIGMVKLIAKIIAVTPCEM